MRSLVIVRIEKCDEPHLYVMQRRELAEEIEAAVARRSPETFHLAPRLRVVRLCVHERDPEATAGERECLAAIRRAVVQVDLVGLAMLAQSLHEHLEHVGLALGRARRDHRDEARRVVGIPWIRSGTLRSPKSSGGP